MTEFSETQLMSRAAWLYYLGGFNQEETAERLGTTRARVNKLLQLAREEGIVSITIDTKHNGLMEVEDRIAGRFGLERCICSPALDLGPASERLPEIGAFSRRAVGSIAARLLRDFLAAAPEATIGTGWGRTLDQMTRQIAGLNAPKARFVSLMGSLTANSAFNPFEVVQALSRITGGEGYFLPVPFIADSPEAREVLISQKIVSEVLQMARKPDMALISVGELTETSLLHSTGMLDDQELAELHRAGAVGDTNGIFFDNIGRPVEHELNNRTIAVGFDELRESHTVLLSGGVEKAEATLALLNSGIVKTLVIDGDTACRICDNE
ncbi:sugar-binding transcriptional regulator [Paracoccus alkanivorans]|uniref:Sugar-binding transcriptional regulator n=1 Tax=Paracoccus alkanivorans TaxID=2116655 RepID=A0A3M0MK21_9RHOB|nr:sugar-binding transcriptional regulator [Paracoccus alkanivorans]RMC37969.1 sugar-binding transcriptional regulator [Paracoccus alkanivorans]